jgi:arylsulfatase A-like enzyme
MTPNVLLLVVDSLRADVVFGDRVKTPTFDSYGESGASFEQCIATCTTTTPSFSSILTATYPPKHGVRGLQGYRLSPAVTTMAEAFAGAGYNTYAEVTGPLLPETGVLRGFSSAHHRQAYKVPFFGWRDEVIDRMRSQRSPWLMLLHIWEVHRPFRSPPDFEKKFDRAGYEAAVTATDEWLSPIFDVAGEEAIVAVTGDHGEEYPDSALGLGAVRAARKARKVLQPSRWSRALDRKLSSVVVGHGFALHEHLIRVPLVLSGPGVGRRTIGDQVRHIDLFPTVAELCGVSVPPGIDGRSLVPLIAGETLPEEPAYLEAVGVKLEGDRILGARIPQWKLLRRGHDRPQLFSLDGDRGPDERHNRAARHPDVARRLEQVIETINASTATPASGMTEAEEASVEQHLKDLGYL